MDVEIQLGVLNHCPCSSLCCLYERMDENGRRGEMPSFSCGVKLVRRRRRRIGRGRGRTIRRRTLFGKLLSVR